MTKKYIEKIKRIRTDSSKSRWSKETLHKAPHKPFLLLSIIDIFNQGTVFGNFIEHSYELVDTFNGYWRKIMPISSSTSMAYPFSRLANDKLWKLLPNPKSKTSININSISSMVKLRKVSIGAEIEDDFRDLLIIPETRESLRLTIIKHFFSSEVQYIIEEHGKTNLKAYKYSNKILSMREKIASFNDSKLDKNVRKQGFRRTITKIYEHRCALCGIRMLTPEGHTVVEAAHVIPWSKTHDDKPTNGMALCKLCHWSFDEGLMGVGKEYNILVSDRVRVDKNLPGHILTLSDRLIYTPEEKAFWPKEENLKWHRQNVFI